VAIYYGMSENFNMKALKLDASFRPIEIIDAVEALVMCFIGKATAVETYTRKIRSATQVFQLPAVIVLKKIIKFRRHGIQPTRQNLLWRDGHRCQYCTRCLPTNQLTLDHVIPKSRGGGNTWENLVVACKKCNQKKGCRLPSESGMCLLKPPRRPRESVLRSIKKNQISNLWNNYLWEKI